MSLPYSHEVLNNMYEPLAIRDMHSKDRALIMFTYIPMLFSVLGGRTCHCVYFCQALAQIIQVQHPFVDSVCISEKASIHKLFVKMLETSLEHMKNQSIIHVNQLGVGLRIYLECCLYSMVYGARVGVYCC